jgi:hypothetical protein
VRTRLKLKELIFALEQKSERRVRKLLETLGLYFALFSKSAEVTENMAVGTFVPAKEFVIC